jgi:hypothetical protein
VKNIIYIYVVFLINCSAAASQSDITIDAGATIDVSTGADLCAGTKHVNGTATGAGTWCNGPLPVLLGYFNAAAVKNNVKLIWQTVWEMNNSGFRVERLGAKGNIWENAWKEIGFVAGSGTINVPRIYFFEDSKLASGEYKYRLKQVDYNGNFEYYPLYNEVIINAPNAFNISQNYPNPSNPKSKIDYDLPLDMKVILKVYDIAGKEIIILTNEVQTAGYHIVEFDGTNFASGVYFYRIDAEGGGQKFTKTLKMVIVK